MVLAYILVRKLFLLQQRLFHISVLDFRTTYAFNTVLAFVRRELRLRISGPVKRLFKSIVTHRYLYVLVMISFVYRLVLFLCSTVVGFVFEWCANWVLFLNSVRFWKLFGVRWQIYINAGKWSCYVLSKEYAKISVRGNLEAFLQKFL